MDLEFEKYCKVDQSPRTVLPYPQHHSKHEKGRRQKPKSSSRNNQLSLEEGFKEIKFCNYNRSISCKALPTKDTEFQFPVDREKLQRGSIYQSSKERTSFKRPSDCVNRRKKIEFSGSGGAPFSFSLLDSICGSDEEHEEEEPCSSKETSLRLDDREMNSSRSADRDFMSNSKFKCDEVISPSSNANMLKEDDIEILQKTLSANLALPHSPTHSESDDGSKRSLGLQFTPINKMVDAKSDNGSIRLLGSRKKTVRKSLLHDFSRAMPHTDQEEIGTPCLPVHLHGDLKLEHKHGVRRFELSLFHSDNVLVAKTWKAEHALDWVYTFHSFQGRKKRNKGSSSLVGQMKVSCHLCSELKEGGSFSDSMMTEFVLYGLAAEESEPDLVSLNPSHEIGAVVIQAPFEKRESLKHRSRCGQVHPSLLDVSLGEQTSKGDTTIVNVVTPLGNHGLPTCESNGPLSLLERWRLGGGCDCGGWDMACPLVVFDNLSARCGEEPNSLLHNNQPFKLYLKGAKEKTPALTMKHTRKGQYSIDFHAQLSALQAFAICVTVLHASEASSSDDQEKQKQLLQCSSKEAIVEDEVKNLIEAITEETKNKRREKAIRSLKDHPHSFVLNPPFSPIAKG